MKEIVLFLGIAGITTGCGGSGGGNASAPLPDTGQTQVRDCSYHHSQGVLQPLPEYPGYPVPDTLLRYTPEEYIANGVNPEGWLAAATLSLLFTYMGSDEGMTHMGPEWHAQESGDGYAYEMTVRYTQSLSVPGEEGWDIYRHGIGPGGDRYHDSLYISVAQRNDCSLSMTVYDTDGRTVTDHYEDTGEQSEITSYKDGQLISHTLVKVNADGSGQARSYDAAAGSAFLSWEADGRTPLLTRCEDEAMENCRAVTSL